MVKVIKLLAAIIVFLFLTLIVVSGFKIGFSNLLALPGELYVWRWQKFETPGRLVDKWGLAKFNLFQWRKKIDRAPQALDLYFSGYLIGKTRTEIEKELGPSDGDYWGSDAYLSYALFDHVIENEDKMMGARWSVIVIFHEGHFMKLKFYKACCQSTF